MIRWLQRYWWALQRDVDLQILWPECKRQAPNIDQAKAAFAVHAFNDPAWVRAYGADLWKVIEGLTQEEA